MTGESFNALLEARIFQMRATLASKASEYATTRDRLHNFKRAAAVQGITPARALVGMWTKHLVLIFDLVDAGWSASINPGRELPTEMIDEKIGDAINYLVLLEAIFKETGEKCPAKTADCASRS